MSEWMKCGHAAWQETKRFDGEKMELWKQNKIRRMIWLQGESHYNNTNEHLGFLTIDLNKKLKVKIKLKYLFKNIVIQLWSATI